MQGGGHKNTHTHIHTYSQIFSPLFRDKLSFPLLGAPKRDLSNNRERDWVLALGGRRSDIKCNNQPKVGVSSEGIIIEEMQLRQNVWGGRRIIVWGWQIERQKNKKMKYTVAFGRPPIDNGSHNNQPKTGFGDRGEYGDDVHQLGGTGGSTIPLFWRC